MASGKHRIDWQNTRELVLVFRGERTSVKGRKEKSRWPVMLFPIDEKNRRGEKEIEKTKFIYRTNKSLKLLEENENLNAKSNFK